MLSTKKIFSTVAIAVLMGTGALVATAGTASARVVCNAEGDCWHTDTNDTYPGPGFTYHPDDWYFHQTWDSNHHWRDYHEGHGYYRNGLWLNL